MKEIPKNYKIGEYRSGRKKKLKVWILISALSLFLLLLVFLAKVIISWSELNVSSVKFLNQTNVSNSSLMSRLENQMLTNKLRALLGPGNILFWSLGQKPSSLGSLPEIKKLNVNADLMGRTVSIEATPRTPFGVICEATSTDCFVFDKSGIIFAPSPDVQGPLILKINDFTSRHLILGEDVLPEANWFNNFLNTVNILKLNNFAISEIDFSDLSLREWQVHFVNAPTFYFSFDFVPDNLGYILSNLSSRMDFSKVSYVDFRVPDRIYYK